MTHMPTRLDRPLPDRSSLAHATHARPLPSMIAPAPAPIPVHDAQDLTGGGSVAHIRLDAQTYTLRITRQGKLILTK